MDRSRDHESPWDAFKVFIAFVALQAYMEGSQVATMEHVDDDGLRGEFAEDDVDGDGVSRWNRPSLGVPTAFKAVQYPLVHFGHGVPLDGRESTANLLVNLLAVGVLTAPRALALVGLAMVLLVLAGVAAASCQTLLALVRHTWGRTHRASSFPVVDRHAPGPQGLGLVLLAYVLYSGGLFIAYLVTLVDMLQQVMAAVDMPCIVYVFISFRHVYAQCSDAKLEICICAQCHMCHQHDHDRCNYIRRLCWRSGD